MPLTYAELLERLKNIDEVSLLEILELTSEDLVDNFRSRVEEKYDYLISELEDEEDDPAT